MDHFNNLILSLLPAFDVVVAILVTLYISVAIFAAQNIFKTGPEAELNVSGRHYIKLLRFNHIAAPLVTMPLLVRIGNLDIFAGDYSNIKALFLFLALAVLTVVTIGEIRGIITQKALNTDLTADIKHPNLKFATWLIENEADWTIEKRDLIASSLTSFNKSSIPFDEFILKEIKSDTDKLIAAKTKQREHGEYLISLLNILKDNWNKRPLGYPVYIDALFEYLFQSWKQVNDHPDLYRAGGIYNLKLAFLNCMNSLAKYCLGASALSYDFFTNLDKFLKTLSDEEVRKFFINFDDTIFFESIPASPERRMIWEDSMPAEWKFTYENLVEKPNPVAVHLYRRFLEWAQNRFFKDTRVDEALDEVTSNMFPDLDPIIWARLLEYRWAPWAGNEHLRYIVSKTSTFGFGKSYPVHDYVDEATTLKHMQEDDKKMMEATVKFATGTGMFNSAFVNQVLNEVKKLEKDKKLSDREKRKLTQHKAMFKELQAALSKKTKPRTNSKSKAVQSK